MQKLFQTFYTCKNVHTWKNKNEADKVGILLKLLHEIIVILYWIIFTLDAEKITANF